MWKLLEAILAIWWFFFPATDATVYGPVWVSFWMAARPLRRRPAVGDLDRSAIRVDQERVGVLSENVPARLCFIGVLCCSTM
jgi:hypothetical protein